MQLHFYVNAFEISNIVEKSEIIRCLMGIFSKGFFKLALKIKVKLLYLLYTINIAIKPLLNWFSIRKGRENPFRIWSALGILFLFKIFSFFHLCFDVFCMLFFTFFKVVRKMYFMGYILFESEAYKSFFFNFESKKRFKR